MVSPTFRFSGITSGLDTEAMVDALMAVERAPITRLQIRRAEYNSKVDAWTSITTKLSEFRTAVDSTRTSADFASFVNASSSNEDAVSVSLTGSPAPTSLSITVEQLAATHQLTTGSGFADSSALVDAGTFTVTSGGNDYDITTDGSTTLADLASAITDADAGVTASVVEVTPGDTRLLVTSSTSGAGGQFTVSSDIAAFATSDITAQGQDATVRLGNPLTGLQLTRSSNVFENVVDGLSFTVHQVTTGPVDLTVARDTDAATAAITEIFTTANALLTELETQSAFDATANTAAPLTGDAAVRNMVLDIHSALGDVVPNDGSISHLGQLGISLGRDGTYAIDETTLASVVESNFDDITSMFLSANESSSNLTVVAGANVPGTFQVTVDVAAEGPETVGAVYSSSSQLREFNVGLNGGNALVTVPQNSTIDQAIASIRSDLDAAGATNIIVDKTAVAGGEALRFTVPDAIGSANVLAIWNDSSFGLNNIATGVDIAGSIGGEAATGSGDTLTVSTGDPAGISVRVDVTPGEVGGGGYAAGVIGATQGLGARLDEFLDELEGIDGSITRARNEWDGRIEDVNDSISAFEDRMVLREQTIRQQFTAMEQALSQLQGQGGFLTSLLPAAPASSQ